MSVCRGHGASAQQREMSDQHFHPLISPFLILSLRAIIIKKEEEEEEEAEWVEGRHIKIIVLLLLPCEDRASLLSYRGELLKWDMIGAWSPHRRFVSPKMEMLSPKMRDLHLLPTTPSGAENDQSCHWWKTLPSKDKD